MFSNDSRPVSLKNCPNDNSELPGSVYLRRRTRAWLSLRRDPVLFLAARPSTENETSHRKLARKTEFGTSKRQKPQRKGDLARPSACLPVWFAERACLLAAAYFYSFFLVLNASSFPKKMLAVRVNKRNSKWRRRAETASTTKCLSTNVFWPAKEIRRRERHYLGIVTFSTFHGCHTVPVPTISRSVRFSEHSTHPFYGDLHSR